MRSATAGERAESLGERSRWTDIDGPVHYLDFGGPRNGPLIVCVHGLGGSAVNWSALAPLLTPACRLVAPDLAGHGLTRSGGRGTDVASNTRLLHRFIGSVSNGPVILMGNSMGGMISLLQTIAEPQVVAGLILVDPALPFVRSRPDLLVTAMFALAAAPMVGPLVVRSRHMLPVESVVARTLALCCADPSRVPREVVAEHVQVARFRARAGIDDDGRDFANAARSVVETASHTRGRAYRRGIAQVSCPVLIVHGQRDRLVPVAAARQAARAHPGWSLVELPGVGHVPQLEAPAETAQAVTAWLAGPGKAAAKAATWRRPARG